MVRGGVRVARGVNVVQYRVLVKRSGKNHNKGLVL